jgi:hypothetical protein
MVGFQTDRKKAQYTICVPHQNGCEKTLMMRPLMIHAPLGFGLRDLRMSQ